MGIFFLSNSRCFWKRLRNNPEITSLPRHPKKWILLLKISRTAEIAANCLAKTWASATLLEWIDEGQCWSIFFSGLKAGSHHCFWLKPLEAGIIIYNYNVRLEWKHITQTSALPLLENPKIHTKIKMFSSPSLYRTNSPVPLMML